MKEPKSLPGLLHIFTHERCTNLITQDLQRCPLHSIPAHINEAFVNDYQLGIGDMRGTPLQVAVARHYSDIAKFLLEKGAEVNISCAGASHPLHIVMSRYSWATKPEHMAIIEALLRNGADVSATSEVGESALHAAARIGSDLLELLLRAGANKDARDSRGRTVLDTAVLSRNLGIVKTCIAHGVSVNASDVNGDRTLHAAIRLHAAAQTKDQYAPVRTHNEFEIVELLLESGADVHATDASGKTALSVALECRSAVMVETCIMHGADVNARLDNGDGILHTAAKLASDPEMADFLLQSEFKTRRTRRLVERLFQSGVDIHATTAIGMTALDVVAATGGDSFRLTRTYIRKGAVVNANNGPSLLRCAVLSMDLDMTKLILDRGIDVNACDVEGESLLHKLCLEGDVNTYTRVRESRRYSPRPSSRLAGSRIWTMLRLILEQGADVNCRTGRGETTLHAMAQRTSVGTLEVELLLRYGADYKARDDQGNTALQIATKSRNSTVGKCLRRVIATATHSANWRLEHNGPEPDSPRTMGTNAPKTP